MKLATHPAFSTSANETGNVRINVTLRRNRVTIVAVEKQEVLYILCASVVLVMQHAKRMCHIMLSSLVCLGVPYFSTLRVMLKTAQFSGGKVIERTAYILIFCTTFVGKFSHSKENSVRYSNKCA
jgi:hypothetical protein